MKKNFALILTILWAFCTYAQDRTDSMHVVHYDLHLDILDFTGHTISGYADLTMVTKVNNLTQYTLDLQGPTVDSVLVDGQQVSFSHQGNKVNIPHLSQQGDTALLRMYYHGTPSQDSYIGGFYYTGQYCYNIGVAFDYQPHSFGRSWLPCMDFFTDKSTYTMHIRTEEGKMAVCGGMLTDTTMLDDGTRIWTWELEQPIPVYLASVAVGEYLLYEDVYNGIEADIPIQIYAQPSTIQNVAGSFAHLKEVLQMYEQYFGPYRWPRVGYVDVIYNSGAMEHATNIAYPHVAFTGTSAYETLYAHELFHLWFGDLITCNRAEEMWVNEGFASYSEALVIGLLHNTATTNAYLDYVRDNHHDVLRNLVKNDGGLYALDNVPQEHTYGSHSYNKGAAVIHTMRNYMGDSLFFSGLRSLLDTYAFQNVSSAQLFDHLTQVTGLDMHDFYEGWVHQPGFLHFSIDSIVPLQGNQYRVYLHQKLYGATHFANNNHADLTFVSDQRELHTIPNVTFSGEFDYVDVNIPFVPAFGIVDYYEKICDATIDYTKTLASNTSWSPENSGCTVKLDNFPDSVLVRVEHNYVAPDQPETLPEHIYRISDSHYWTINMAYNTSINTIPTGSLRFQYLRGADYTLDYALTQGYDVTNLKLLHRHSTSHPWEVVTASRSGSPYNGYFITEELLPGQYCIAVGDPTAAVSEIISENSLYLYPTPAQNSLHILLNIPDKNLKASILDSTGKIVKTFKLKSGENRLDISHLPAGMYIIKAADGNSILVKKFVKK